MLLLIAAVAAVLNTWGIDRSLYHVFYATAVRSMTDSPVAFFYGSFDPGNSITLDKAPGFLWPQVLSAMVFGFHPWALVLPQGVEGVGCVLLLHLLVRRWRGVVPGLLAAGFLALTPVTVGLGRSVVEDAPFVLLLLLAAEATQRATQRARLRTLVLAGAWVGVAFQCKMVEAWAVLPALAVTYLVAAPTVLRRRLLHLALAGAVTVVLSMSWIVVSAVTPAGDRPYIDGTTTNSAFDMVFGYNFLTRFSATGAGAGRMGSVAAATGSTGGHPGLGDSVFKMFAPGLASQAGWLYPLAALALAWGLTAARRRRAALTDQVRAGYLMWGVWLATFFAAFSFGSVAGHTYYLGVIAVALSALSGSGLQRCWRAFRSGSRWAWTLPAVIAANAAWCALLAGYYPAFLPWLAPATIGLCLTAVALFLAAGPGAPGRPRVIVAAGLAAGVLSVLLAPAAWSVSAVSPRYNLAGGMGRVGPTSKPGDAGAARLSPAEQQLLAYLQAHRKKAKYLAAVPEWSDASRYILADNASLLPMGGFTSQVPSPTLGQFRKLVGSGEVHYVMFHHSELVAGRAAHSPTAPILLWVQSHCRAVPLRHYLGETAHGATGAPPKLYHCTTG